MATRTPPNKGLMSRTMALHVRYKSLYISCRPLHNNNVKWLSFGEREQRWLIFVFSFEIERWRYIFSLSKFWDQYAHSTNLGICEIRRQNIDSFFFFTGCCPRGRRRHFPSSPILGAGMAQWWERSLLTNVARVRFRPGAICGLSLLLVLALLRGFFSGFSGFPPSTETNISNSNSTRIEDQHKAS